MKDITKMICYMDEEDVYELAKDAVNGEIDIELEKLFPYMDEGDVYKIAKAALENKIEFNLKETLIYMDEDDVDKLCQQLVDDPEFKCEFSLDDLLPYASEEGIDKLFLHYAKQGKYYESALPYVSDKCLHQFVVNYCENPDFDVDIDALYPYLESKDISLLLKTYLKKRKKTE